MDREPLVAPPPARKHVNRMIPNFNADEPDCMTLVLMGEHIDPKELAELSDQGYASLLILTSGAGAVANLILSVVKIAGGRVYHSKALFADGIHSFSDLVSDIAAGYAGHMSGKKADAKMPYGYGKWEAMGTLMVGVMLLAAAASLIVHLVEHLREVLAGNVQYVEIAAMFVAVVSTIVKEVAFQATFRVGTKINSQVLIANAWHHRSDALSSVVALVGVICARWGLAWADAVAGVCVSLLLLKVGAETLLEASGSLVDKAVTEDVQEAVESCVAGLGKEGKVFQGTLTQLRARQTGRKRALDVTIAFPDTMALAVATEQTEVMRRAIRKEVPNTGEVLVQLLTTGQATATQPTAPREVPAMEHANPNKVKSGSVIHMV